MTPPCADAPLDHGALPPTAPPAPARPPVSDALHRIQEAYREYDREVTISKFKVACVLGMVLVPSFFVVDYLVYPKLAADFLWLRLLCSAMIGVFLAVLLTPFGRRHYRLFGVTLVLIPAALISYMVYATEGRNSPYYAGLNLVLLVVGFVLNWTFRESLVAVSLVAAMYLAACFLPGAGLGGDPPSTAERPPHLSTTAGTDRPDTATNRKNIFANNLYFLLMTGVIVVTGTYYLSQFRYREFVLRFQLDADRRTLEETNRRLTELDQLKSQFFANVSHELRTPLTLLLAPLEALLHAQQSMTPADQRGLLTTMHTHGLRLLKLINDLLDLVRLEAGRSRFQPEPVELEPLIRGFASNIQHAATARNQQLQVALDLPTHQTLIDRDKLEKILLNLLFNAIKFTPTGGRVQLSARRDGEWLLFEVADTGIGIAPEQLPRVFDRFYQADASAQRQHQGLGIGLALAKELTEIQGGQISARSEPGKGSTFTVRLPFLPATAAPTPEPAAREALPSPEIIGSPEWTAGLYRRAELFPALVSTQLPQEDPSDPRSNQPTILIADDEPDMLRFVGSQLALDFHILPATNGRTAVDLALSRRPELIILDMMMPELDGLQACGEIRRHPQTRDLPIILLTARADEETKLAALTAGANDFLTKPFSTAELQLRVRNLIDNHRLQLQLTRQNRRLAETVDLLKETEVQLVQAEKLASLGRLSAGIIHEINNPLNFATTGLFSLQRKGRQLPPEHQAEFREIVEDIDDGIRRVRDIVTDLRAFTHPGAGLPEDVRVGDALQMALRFLSHEWKNLVQVEVAVPESLTVRANHNKLVQVFVNLLQNSFDALRQQPPDAPPPQISIHAHSDALHHVVSVRDNGPGIAASILDKVFDPFFTTKDVGQGLGLGLSISYRILQEYGARLTVTSQPGAFCEFALVFPRPGSATTPTATPAA